jgi:ligand-binding sensor domain-containing protein
MNKIILITIYLFSFLELNAQPQWIIYNTTNSGLPSNDILDVVIDTNNVKWIGTDSGLVKLYNQQWTVYNTSNSPLTSNLIWRLAVDKQNNIWIGTIGHGLIKFDGINWTKYDTISSLGIIISVVFGMQADSLNNLWICFNNGLLKFSNNNWTLYNTTNSGLPDNSTTDIKIENHIKWIGTQWHGLVKYNDTNWVVYNTTNSGLPVNFVRCIFIDKYRNKWIGTYLGGAAKFNSQNNNWILYNVNWPGLPDNDIRTIFVDVNLIKWFGTYGAGAAKYNDTIVITYGYPITSTFINKIVADRYNNIWIATGQQLAINNYNGIIGINQNNSNVPGEIKLYQNYPNPFNPETKILFDIKKSVGGGQNSIVTLKVFDITGREIMQLINEYKQAGYYSVNFNGGNFASGVYFYRLQAGDFTAVKKMLMIK